MTQNARDDKANLRLMLNGFTSLRSEFVTSEKKSAAKVSRLPLDLTRLLRLRSGAIDSYETEL